MFELPCAHLSPLAAGFFATFLAGFFATVFFGLAAFFAAGLAILLYWSFEWQVCSTRE